MTINLKNRLPGAANLENEGYTLKFIHVPTGDDVEFPAFLDMFSDSYSSEWNSEQVYGRMDPIPNFMHTRRALALAWNVPSESYEHAMANLWKANKILS